jgi:hypothetical protein
MGRRNLQALIDEVLGMAKKKMGQGPNTWENAADEAEARSARASEAYNKMYEPPNSTTALDRAAKLKEREMMNTGAENVENIRETGALAREQIGASNKVETANIGLEGIKYGADQSRIGQETMAGAHKYVADQGFASKKYEVDAGGKGGDSFSTLMGKAIESDPSILSDPKKLAETSKNIRSMLPPDIKRGNDYQTDNVLNSSPAPTTPAVPSSVLPKPSARVALNNSNVPVNPVNNSFSNPTMGFRRFGNPFEADSRNLEKDYSMDSPLTIKKNKKKVQGEVI